MRRRKILAVASSLIAGCTTQAPIRDSGTTEATKATDTEVQTREKAKKPVDYSFLPSKDNYKTRSEVQDLINKTKCGGAADSTIICSDDSNNLEIYSSTLVGTLPHYSIKIIVKNKSNKKFFWNKYDWELSKYDGKSWRRIAPLAIPGIIDSLEPSQSHTFDFTADNTKFHGTKSYMDDGDITLSGLNPGIYAFTVSGYFKSDADTDVTLTTVFGFSGKGPQIRPTDAVSNIEKENSELIIYSKENKKENRGRSLIISFGKSEFETSLLPEHVLQVAGLRNTLSYAATDDIHSIRYVSNNNDVSNTLKYLKLLSPSSDFRFKFRDYIFEISGDR